MHSICRICEFRVDSHTYHLLVRMGVIKLRSCSIVGFSILGPLPHHMSELVLTSGSSYIQHSQAVGFNTGTFRSRAKLTTKFKNAWEWHQSENPNTIHSINFRLSAVYLIITTHSNLSPVTSLARSSQAAAWQAVPEVRRHDHHQA